MKCKDCNYETENKKSWSNHIRYGCKAVIKYTNVKCKYCGSYLQKRKPSESGYFCNNKCYFKWKKGILLGARKERVLISNYYYIMMPLHPRSNKKGYVPEHIILIENKIGRLLKEDETVHHIDHNSLNNDLCNLLLMNKHEHLSYHAKDKHLKSKGKRWEHMGKE